MTGLPLRDECPGCGLPKWGEQCLRRSCPIGAVECDRRDRDREKARARAERTAQVRKPPPWPCRTRGFCRLCCSPVPKGRQTWCSQHCVDVWWLATTPSVQAAQLRLTFAGCWECGKATSQVDVDHVRPLWSLAPHERHELKWWLPFNLQLLCSDCHKAKSKREAAERAALRRADPLLEVG